MGQGAPQAVAEVRYRIDADDILVDLNPAWDRFALDNGAPELRGDRVRHRRLWAFIADPDARELHRRLLERLRSTGRAVTLPFRCDSPDTRRFMEMDIVPRADGAVVFHCRLLRSERRRPVALSDAGAGQAGPLVKMCSWCKRIEVAPGDWRELEVAIRALKLFEVDPPPGVSHGWCGTCLDALFPGAREVQRPDPED